MTVEQIAQEDVRRATYHEPVAGKMRHPDSYMYDAPFWQTIVDDYKERGIILTVPAMLKYRDAWIAAYRRQWEQMIG